MYIGSYRFLFIVAERIWWLGTSIAMDYSQSNQHIIANGHPNMGPGLSLHQQEDRERTQCGINSGNRQFLARWIFLLGRCFMAASHAMWFWQISILPMQLIILCDKRKQKTLSTHYFHTAEQGKYGPRWAFGNTLREWWSWIDRGLFLSRKWSGQEVRWGSSPLAELNWFWLVAGIFGGRDDSVLMGKISKIIQGQPCQSLQ